MDVILNAAKAALFVSVLLFYLRYSRTHLTVESNGPKGMAVLAGLLVLSTSELHFEPEGAFFSAQLIAGVFLACFGGVSLGVMMGLSTPLVERMHSSGYIKDVSRYLREMLHSTMTLALFGLLGMAYWDKLSASIDASVLSAVWAGLLTHVLCCTFRNVRLLAKMLQNPDSKPSLSSNTGNT